MRRSIFSASATILGLILFLAAPAVTQAAEITVQPHVLAIQSLGGTVSVHTDIDFSSGSDWTAKINGTLDRNFHVFTHSLLIYSGNNLGIGIFNHDDIVKIEHSTL